VTLHLQWERLARLAAETPGSGSRGAPGTPKYSLRTPAANASSYSHNAGNNGLSTDPPQHASTPAATAASPGVAAKSPRVLSDVESVILGSVTQLLGNQRVAEQTQSPSAAMAGLSGAGASADYHGASAQKESLSRDIIAARMVGRCSLTVAQPVLTPPMVSALEHVI